MDARTHAVTPLIAVLALLLGLGTFGARADNANSTDGTPPPNTTGWILVSKPPKQPGDPPPPKFPGVQVFAGADGSVLLADNPVTKAAGKIGDAHEPNCLCKHYHGKFGDAKDPDEDHCGWGCVSPAASAPASVGAVSKAVMRELRALHKIGANDLAGAIDDVLRSIDALHDAQLHPPMDTNWNHGDTKKYEKDLKEAEKDDDSALESLRSAQTETDPDIKKKKLDKAKDKLDDGLKVKGQESLHLGKKLGLAPNGRGD